jgi:hypothetical protein
MMSTGSTADQSMVVMSPWLGMWGQWWARIFAAPWAGRGLVLVAGSCSLNQAGWELNTLDTATPSPLYPVNRLPSRSAAVTVSVR